MSPSRVLVSILFPISFLLIVSTLPLGSNSISCYSGHNLYKLYKTLERASRVPGRFEFLSQDFRISTLISPECSHGHRIYFSLAHPPAPIPSQTQCLDPFGCTAPAFVSVNFDAVFGSSIVTPCSPLVFSFDPEWPTIIFHLCD